MAPLTILPVDEGRVLGHAVVPDDNGALLPLDTGLEVGSIGQMVVEELEDGVRFLLLHAYNFTGDYILSVSWTGKYQRKEELDLHCELT